MSDIPVRQELVDMLPQLTEEQIAVLLAVAREMKPAAVSQRAPYDPEKDIFLKGLFEGPEDLAERVEDILEEESRKRGSWTIKESE